MNGKPIRLHPILRSLHIYISVLGLVLILFYSVTGFMLNHSEWFGMDTPRTRTIEGTLPSAVMAKSDLLSIVEELRKNFGAVGAMDPGSVDSFEKKEDPLRVVFVRPGSRCEAVIERDTGKVTMTIDSANAAGILGALHKGDHAGRAWKLCIDATAILLASASVTGLILWFTLPKRRKLGVIALIVGLALLLLAWWALTA